MKIYTFRTEMACDNIHVPKLIKLLGAELVSEEEISDSLCEFYKMGKFTFKSDKSLYVLQCRMMEIFQENEEMLDMYRCAQTLQEGLEPNERWFMS